MSYKRKKEILNDLLTDASNMEYENKKNDLQLFTQKLQNVLPYLFENYQEKFRSFSAIKFRPSAYSLGVDNTQLFKRVFSEGKQSTINFVTGLIHAIDFEHSLSNEENNPTQKPETIALPKTKVFIVHGHDDSLKTDVARFIERQGLEALILHEQVSRGNTIIEKIEANSDVGFAIILYTPCDFGRASNSEEEQPRARQNVIFEHGYFVAKLGRSNVVALHKGNVEIPNDLSGVVYTPYDEFGAWKRSIAHELSASGYKIDFERV